MIAARALQGVGAAIVAPTSLALITAYFEGEARSRAVAWYAATAGIGASLGLLVGGALTDLVSWRAAFLVNVPIAIAMIVGARARADRDAAATRALRRRRRAVRDARHGRPGVRDHRVRRGRLGLGPGGRRPGRRVVLLAALVVNEARVAQPIMPLRLFASRERSGAYAARMLYLGRDDRLLLLHHPAHAGRARLHPAAGRPGVPADVAGQLRRRAGHPAAERPGPRTPSCSPPASG